MSIDSRLRLLLDRWKLSQQTGQPLSMEELCRDCPELQPQLEHHLAAADGPTSPSTAPPPWCEPNPSAVLPTIADVSPPPPPISTTGKPMIPGYDIECELARGGMGVVYRARQLPLNRVVALKMILTGVYASPEERLRFLSEAKVIASITHPGIVQLHDFGTHGGAPYFALEYCPGGTLADRLGGTPLPSRTAASIVEQIARAVQAAHDKGIIHRDLKPANVLFQKDEGGRMRDEQGRSHSASSFILHPSSFRPKITDFGLARNIQGSSGLTQTGMPLGTPSYMAPEQAVGQKDVGPEADVYALGAILYECLTGRPPFKAASAMETLEQVRLQEPVTPSSLQPGVPRDLETICLKALQKEPGHRYTSAAELADDLRRWQAGEPIHARPIGPTGRAVKWVRRRPLLAGMAAATVLALVGGTAISMYFAFDAREQKKEAVDAVKEMEENLALGLLRPLGHFQDEKRLNDFELDTLEELASIPPERDRVRLLFFDKALSGEARAGQLERRLEEAVIAAVGLRLDLRKQAQALAGQRLRDPSVSPSIRIAAARLAADLRAGDPEVVGPAANVLIEELIGTEKSASLPGLAKDLERIATRANPTEAARLGKQVIELVAGTTEPQILRSLSQTFATLARKLGPDQAAVLGKQVAEAASAATDVAVLSTLTQAYAALAERLTPAEAGKLAAALGKRISERAEKTTEADALRDLSRALASSVLGRLEPAEAEKLARAVGKQVAEAAAGTTNAGDLRRLAAALAVLSSKLPSLEAGKLALALGKQIVEVAGQTTEESVPEVTGKSSDESTSPGLIVRESRLALSTALAAVWNLLPAAEASRLGAALGKQIVEVASKTTNVYLVRGQSEALAVLSARLSTAQVSTFRAALVKQIVEAAGKTTEAAPLRELSEALAALPGRPSASDAAALDRHIALRAATTTDAGNLRALAQAYAALAGQLSAEQAASRAAALAGQVTSLTDRATGAAALGALCEAFAAVAGKLPPAEAGRQAAALAKQVTDLAAQATGADALRALAQAVVALAPWLPAETTASAAALVAPRLARTLHSQRDNRDVAAIFEKLCGLLSPPQLVDLLKQPGCVEPGPPIIVRCLGRHFHRDFRDVWDVVEHMENEGIALDCSTPLLREQGTPRAATRQERRRSAQ
jgi:hypothetical protein